MGQGARSHQVYVIDDSQIYGKGVADVFERRRGRPDGPRPRQITGKETDYKALAEKIKAARRPTWSTSVASPSRTPASSGATCATPWATQPDGPRRHLRGSVPRGGRRGSRRHLHDLRRDYRRTSTPARQPSSATITRPSSAAGSRSTRSTGTRPPMSCSRRIEAASKARPRTRRPSGPARSTNLARRRTSQESSARGRSTRTATRR